MNIRRLFAPKGYIVFFERCYEYVFYNIVCFVIFETYEIQNTTNSIVATYCCFCKQLCIVYENIVEEASL